jgi:hypothetical protein
MQPLKGRLPLLALPARVEKQPLATGSGIASIKTDVDQYSIRSASEAAWRVFFCNPPQGDSAEQDRILRLRDRNSLVGKYGHWERSNAWTHIIGAVLFAIYSAVRPVTPLDSSSSAGLLSAVSSGIVIAVFAVSTIYHTYCPVRWLSPIVRVFDHGAIYISLGVATTADAALATLDFEGVPWQGVVDGALVAFALLVFFTCRRLVLDPSFTEIAWGTNRCLEPPHFCTNLDASPPCPRLAQISHAPRTARTAPSREPLPPMQI